MIVAASEAKSIGHKVGRSPVSVSDPYDLSGAMADPQAIARVDAASARHLGTPCPFLQAGECSIYEQRPMACRYHVSLDRDAPLCELVEGRAPETFYLDMTHHKAAYLTAFGLSQAYADIRDWFAQVDPPDVDPPRPAPN